MSDWNTAVAQLNDAIASFMNDGAQTPGGTWILTMNQSKSECLRSARDREVSTRATLHRIIDDVHDLEVGHVTHGSTAIIN